MERHVTRKIPSPSDWIFYFSPATFRRRIANEPDARNARSLTNTRARVEWNRRWLTWTWFNNCSVYRHSSNRAFSGILLNVTVVTLQRTNRGMLFFSLASCAFEFPRILRDSYSCDIDSFAGGKTGVSSEVVPLSIALAIPIFPLCFVLSTLGIVDHNQRLNSRHLRSCIVTYQKLTCQS